jgi:hypothetical protein
MRSAAALFALLFAAGACAGCGYTTESPHPANIRTVAVPIFQNKDFRRGLEFELTQELIKMIELRTPYKVVSKEHADTIINGRIDGLAESILTEDERANSTETQVTMSITFEWKDLRTGKTLKVGSPQQSWYYAPAEHQTYRSASGTVIHHLAEQIVEMMEKDW